MPIANCGRRIEDAVEESYYIMPYNMVKIATRSETSALSENLLRNTAVLIALATLALIMLFMGYKPLDVYERLVSVLWVRRTDSKRR
jgi:hypothetical protein